MKTEDVKKYISDSLGKIKWGGKNILMIISDRTRTAPVAEMVRIIHPILRGFGLNVDFIVAGHRTLADSNLTVVGIVKAKDLQKWKQYCLKGFYLKEHGNPPRTKALKYA